jgi:uncharacterized iron-regulated membrane protein
MKGTMRFVFFMLLALGLGPALSLPAYAGQSDQDRARSAVQEGQIKSLDVILSSVRQQVPGRVVGVNLRGGNGSQRPYVYDVRVLSPQGNIKAVEVDARTAQILSVRGNDADDRGRGRGQGRGR